MNRYLIYALGGGFGHMTRACAVARAARPGTGFRILTNSPYARCVQHASPELDLVAMDPHMTLHQGCTEVIRQIDAAAPEGLIVDTFPRGLGGELVDLLRCFRGPKILVERDLNPQYLAAFHLHTFVLDTYDLVLNPGDAGADGLGPFPQAVTTPPWLVRSWEEVLPRDQARERLSLRDEKPCILVCATGNSTELAWYGEVCSHLVKFAAGCHVRCIAPACPEGCPSEFWRPYWPAIELFAAADGVVGGAGYHTVYECQACGVPLIARPWPRQYDRQRLRGQRAALVMVDEPQEAAAAAFQAVTRSWGPRPAFRYRNGAAEAIELVENLGRQTGK